MTAHIVAPTPEVAELLERFEAGGGVLEFFFIAVGADASGDDERHRIAAELALRSAQQKIDAWGESVVRDYDGERDDYFRVTIPPGFTPTGHQVSVDEFLGPMFSRVLGFQRRAAGALYGDEMAGIAYALMEPPYTLKESRELFVQFKTSVFADFPDDMVIYTWETSGLNYFDAGREWWGTFYWTVQVSKDEPIVAILGSSTD